MHPFSISPFVAASAVEWLISDKPVEYVSAVATMEQRVEAIIHHTAPECVWLLEHPPLYTAGTSAIESDLLSKDRLPVFKTGRGGQFTYHGPGQRVAYVMLDVKRRSHPKPPDIRHYVTQLEQWLIATLAQLGLAAFTRPGRVGVWVENALHEEVKIAALGIRLRKWVSYHGIALNVNPDLSHYQGIVPCGIQAYGVTSLESLGIAIGMEELDAILYNEFNKIFR